MPNRIIREGILTSDRVDQLDPPAEVFYRRLLSKVDDYGRFDGRVSVLRASLYPLRVDRVREADISRWMAACQKAGLIALYSHDGKPYLEANDTGWTARSPSKYPDPRASANICTQVQTNARLDVDVVLDVVVDEDVVHPRASSRRKGESTFSAWVQSLGDEEAIPPSDPVFAWARDAGIPEYMLALAWLAFDDRYSGESKRYTDWRAVFRKAVKGNWMKVWYVDQSGSHALTTTGKQWQAVNERGGA